MYNTLPSTQEVSISAKNGDERCSQEVWKIAWSLGRSTVAIMNG